MSDEQKADRQFAIQRIYTKDISFESPNAPQVFISEWEPKINVDLSTEIQALSEDTIQVVLTVNVVAKHEDKTAFLVEVQQAGIFLAKGFSEEELGPLMGIGAPNALYPYAREVVSDLITRGSFPQFTLQPVNFEQMYAQQMASKKESAEKTH
jgi:preprotein translocase subunit SecB